MGLVLFLLLILQVIFGSVVRSFIFPSLLPTDHLTHNSSGSHTAPSDPLEPIFAALQARSEREIDPEPGPSASGSRDPGSRLGNVLARV